MTIRRGLMKILMQEDLNFLLTNRLPRRLATQAMGRFSRIEQGWMRDASIRAWRFFSDVDLSDAETQYFASLHHAFVRALRPGARPADPDPNVIASPCDAIVGAHGRIEGDRLYQVKGFPYRLIDLIPDGQVAERFRDGSFVTLRLTAGMYHRFHAPHDMIVKAVTYLSGDCWNVNPIALKRVEKLFCRNERAVIEAELVATGEPILLVPVAAILVASIRLAFLDTQAALREGKPGRIVCDVPTTKGDEMGWFEHGSTIILFVPPGFAMAEGIDEGRQIRAGEALLRRVLRSDAAALIREYDN
jgi:phosphatidylserine decarboxylase